MYDSFLSFEIIAFTMEADDNSFISTTIVLVLLHASMSVWLDSFGSWSYEISLWKLPISTSGAVEKKWHWGFTCPWLIFLGIERFCWWWWDFLVDEDTKLRHGALFFTSLAPCEVEDFEIKWADRVTPNKRCFPVTLLHTIEHRNIWIFYSEVSRWSCWMLQVAEFMCEKHDETWNQWNGLKEQSHSEFWMSHRYLANLAMILVKIIILVLFDVIIFNF